jgi:hypothetical protein
MPKCERYIKIPLQPNEIKSPIFCGRKVNWSPLHWFDKSDKIKTDIDTSIISLLKRTIEKKKRFFGVGLNNNFMILKIDLLYPLDKNDNRNVLGEPSLANLPKKDSGIEIDKRSIPNGRKVNTLNTNELHLLLKELGVKYNKKQKKDILIELLSEELKNKELWIEKTNLKLSRGKNDIIKLYTDFFKK